MIVEYVRKGGNKRYVKLFRDGKPPGTKKSKNRGGCCIGVLVAIPQGDKVKIGWTLCNTKAGDTFDQKFGVKVATDRALKNSERPIASSMIKKAKNFIERVKHFYQDKEIEVTFKWTGQPIIANR